MDNRIKRLENRKREKIRVSIIVDKKNLERAKKILDKPKGKSIPVSQMFDMFLEDFVYEDLPIKARTEIDKADLKDIQ